MGGGDLSTAALSAAAAEDEDEDSGGTSGACTTCRRQRPSASPASLADWACGGEFENNAAGANQRARSFDCLLLLILLPLAPLLSLSNVSLSLLSYLSSFQCGEEPPSKGEGREFQEGKGLTPNPHSLPRDSECWSSIQEVSLAAAQQCGSTLTATEAASLALFLNRKLSIIENRLRFERNKLTMGLASTLAQSTKPKYISAPSKKGGIEDRKAHDEKEESVYKDGVSVALKSVEEDENDKSAQRKKQVSFAEDEVRCRRFLFFIFLNQNRPSFILIVLIHAIHCRR